jgi:2,3-dihydroxybiphenyl 1,2-dioxygenase
VNEIELAYLQVEVADPTALGSFLTDVVGLAPGTPTADGDATWSNDDAAQRLVVSRGSRDDLVALGVEATDDAAFDATVARLTAAGFAPTEADADLHRARRVERLVTVAAPWGSTVEVALGLERTPAPAPTPLVPGGFLTAGQGFGHAVVATTAFDEAVRFATDGLGMVRSDWLETEVAEGIVLEVRFFHCNARHHSLALARAPFDLPQVLHHVMVETNERDDVGRAYDRAVAAGLPLPNGLGRHDNDHMFSFYVASPAGFQVEVGHGARQITEPWTDDRRYDRISAWGHHPVAPS